MIPSETIGVGVSLAEIDLLLSLLGEALLIHPDDPDAKALVGRYSEARATLLSRAEKQEAKRAATP